MVQRPKAQNQAVSKDRNKFMEVIHPLSPPGITVWVSSLREVTTRVNSALRAQTHVDAYAVPDPGMFLQSKSCGIYFTNWLRSRSSWIWLLQRSGIEAQSIPNQIWRDLLFHGIPDPSMSSQHLPTSNKKTASEKRAARLEKIKDILFADTEGELRLIEPADVITWRDAPVTFNSDNMPSDRVIREVLWELYEINF
jgi:hypothetical protein